MIYCACSHSCIVPAGTCSSVYLRYGENRQRWQQKPYAECETGSEGGTFGEKYKTEIYRSDRIAGHCFRRIYVCTEWIDVK